MTIVLVVLGGGIGAGIWLVIWGLGVTDAPPVPPRIKNPYPDLRWRLAGSAIAGAIAVATTRWPVAVLAAMGLGFFFRDVFFANERGASDVERSVAVASWTEMLRDTLSASSGLEEAIAATAPLAPPAIRPALAGLMSRLGQVPLAVALADFANDLADPTGDLVASALILGARGEAQQLAELLSALAESARDDASMRLEVQAARAATQTSVRVVAGITIAMVAGLLLLNRSYLKPYQGAGGQAVLAIVFGLFAVGLIWLRRMTRFRAPERFLAPQAERA
jgi:Flp pilus assembly protein TadB